MVSFSGPGEGRHTQVQNAQEFRPFVTLMVSFRGPREERHTEVSLGCCFHHVLSGESFLVRISDSYTYGGWSQHMMSCCGVCRHLFGMQFQTLDRKGNHANMIFSPAILKPTTPNRERCTGELSKLPGYGHQCVRIQGFTSPRPDRTWWEHGRRKFPCFRLTQSMSTSTRLVYFA